MILPDEQIAFDMYFASICSMQFHPGAGAKEHRQLTIQECLEKAMEMIEKRRSMLLIREDR